MRIKNILLFLLLTFTLFVICSCGSNNNIVESNIDQEQVDYVCAFISSLPSSISLKDEEDVSYANELYEGLNDEEKALITNYDILENANKVINYFKTEEDVLISEFENTKKYLDEIIPSKIGSDVSSIELPYTYDYKNEFKSYTFRITWATSDPYTITDKGIISHAHSEIKVTLMATIACSGVKEQVKFEKEITVMPTSFKPLKTGDIVAGYYYAGNYYDFTDVDIETLDIVYMCFGQIAKKKVDDKDVYYIDADRMSSGYDKVIKLREKGIRVVFSIGGWQDNSSAWIPYQTAAASEEYRTQVANSAIEVMEKYHFDGLDMDWEYPRSSDKDNYVLLLNAIRKALKAKSEDYIISAAIPAGTWITDQFALNDLNPVLDYFNIMSYDLNEGSRASHHSSLASIISTCDFFVKRGVSKEKIIVGAAFYGKKFTGVANTNNGLNQRASDVENITFTEIYEKYYPRIGKGTEKYYDETKKSYYLYDATNQIFICFDSEEAVRDKFNYAKDNGYGGLMFWSLNEDSTHTLITSIHDAKYPNE